MTAQIERLSAELQRFVSALETVGLTKELQLTTLSSSSSRNHQSLCGKISKLPYYMKLTRIAPNRVNFMER